MHDVDLTPDLYFAAEIVKAETQPDGSVLVYGCPANPETLDNDDQIADAGWLKEALPAWFHSYGNLREMHQPSAVGTAKKLTWADDKPEIVAKVVDPIAAKKVREGVYKAFSIGVQKPELAYDRNAAGGRIVGGKIVETSLVDRPSIPGSDIASFKAAVQSGFMLCKAVGVNEWLDTQMGVVLEDTAKASEADVEKRDFDRNVGGGVDRDQLPAEDFAGRNRSFPIDKPGDVSDAASSIGRAGEDNYSPEQLKENIIRIARRKGPAYVAELPESWKGDGDKAASVDDGKSVEAPIDSAKEASPTMNDEKTVDAEKGVDSDFAGGEKAAEAETSKGDDREDTDLGETAKTDEADEADKSDEAEKLAELAKDASAYCPKCASLQKVADGRLEKIGAVDVLLGKCDAGHELRKVLQTPLTKSDDAEKSGDAEKADDAEKSDEIAKDSTMNDSDLGADADGDDDGDKSAGSDAEKALAAAVEKVDDEAVKAAVAELLKDAGIDLGKVGRKMKQQRLDRLTAAIGELSELAKELTADPAGEKAANVGGPTQTDGGSNLAATRFVSCLRTVNELARLLAPGDGDFGLSTDGADTQLDDTVAAPIRIKDRINTNSDGKAVTPDLTKAEIIDEATKLVAPELAKSVAQEIGRAFSPLVERLEKVEHTLVPARPPVLIEADRRHVLNADATKAAEQEEALKADLEKSLGGLSDQQREQVLAFALSQSRRGR